MATFYTVHLSGSGQEGTIDTFTLIRSGDLPAQTIYANTFDDQGTTNDGDFAPVHQAITFAAGQTQATISVSLLNDGTASANETFAILFQQNPTDGDLTYLAKSLFTIQGNSTGGTGGVPPGTGPASSNLTINTHDVSVPANTSVPGSSLITSVSNPSNHTIGGYAFWDAGGGSGHISLDGTLEADGQWIVVDSTHLSSIQYIGGSSASSETIYVEVYDSTASSWSAYSFLTATTTASSSSVIQGTSGDDTFHTGGGSKTFNGGGGHDTLIFQGSSSEYTYTQLSDGSLSFTDSVSSRDYVDIFINIEFLQFTNGTIFVENSDNANIARLYSAAFDRAPDIAGLSFWENIYASNVSSSAKSAGYYVSLAETTLGSGTSIAGGFMQSSEFINRYGSLSDSNFVIQLYQNVLGRGPDQAGLNFWVNQLEGGGQTREIVLVGFAESPENVAKTAAEWLIAV